MDKKQLRRWHIELTLHEGKIYFEKWDLCLPDGEFVGFDDGWFKIGHNLSINQQMILKHDIKDCGLVE